jgi:hypothetical protein
MMSLRLTQTRPMISNRMMIPNITHPSMTLSFSVINLVT